MIEIVNKNACVYCGGDVKASYVDENTKCFAEAADCCADCWNKIGEEL